MKLIWVLPENKGQNNNFRPNRVRPRVNRSTGQPVTEQCITIGRPVVCNPVDRTGQPVRPMQSGPLHRSTGYHVIRSTRQVDRWH
ncbi:hypothetical protein L484_000905 [Morus notabilis]|uniref:Uncharacterized protein n=1 Tax=Morus notabilis TaxID=981085 RepID=W9R160_9ROSA|nr:hypothetical protein L484_000905 [Morus notabilis]